MTNVLLAVLWQPSQWPFCGFNSHSLAHHQYFYKWLLLLPTVIIVGIRMHRVFVLRMCLVCSWCGRPIAYCEMGKWKDGKVNACWKSTKRLVPGSGPRDAIVLCFRFHVLAWSRRNCSGSIRVHLHSACIRVNTTLCTWCLYAHATRLPTPIKVWRIYAYIQTWTDCAARLSALC